MRDRGSMSLLVMCVAVTMAVVVGTALTPVLVVLHDRQRAQTAADAAALAAVRGGRAAASAMAATNGGELTSFELVGAGLHTTVSVTVRVGDSTARARATNGP